MLYEVRNEFLYIVFMKFYFKALMAVVSVLCPGFNFLSVWALWHTFTVIPVV